MSSKSDLPVERDRQAHELIQTTAADLESREFQFAVTMADNPHCYTKRPPPNEPGTHRDGKWRSYDDRDGPGQEDYSRLVKMIHTYGEYQWYYGKKYVILPLNGQFYWTMGWPPEQTTIINRKPFQYTTGYDVLQVADRYDQDNDTDRQRAEDAALRARLDEIIQPGLTVLDMGCRTGWLLDNYADRIPPENYAGVDPSEGMLLRHAAKHPAYADRILRCSVRDFYPPEPFDVMVCLYGVGSHWTTEDLAKLPLLCSGRWLTMCCPQSGLGWRSQLVKKRWGFTEVLHDVEACWNELADTDPQSIGHHRVYSGGV